MIPAQNIVAWGRVARRTLGKDAHDEAEVRPLVVVKSERSCARQRASEKG